jgi:hypothetical protein
VLGLKTVFKAVVKTKPVRLHVQLGRVRREAAAASRWLLSTQLSVKKQVTFVVTKSNLGDRTISCDRIAEAHFAPQCFPTLRGVAHLGNSEHAANMQGKSGLRIHRLFKECFVADHSRTPSVEISRITAGKSVPLQ